MTRHQFRHPKDMTSEKRTPVSARIRESTKETLEAAAKAQKGLSISQLIANVLDDYAAWLETEKKNGK